MIAVEWCKNARFLMGSLSEDWRSFKRIFFLPSLWGRALLIVPLLLVDGGWLMIMVGNCFGLFGLWISQDSINLGLYCDCCNCYCSISLPLDARLNFVAAFAHQVVDRCWLQLAFAFGRDAELLDKKRRPATTALLLLLLLLLTSDTILR